MIARVMEGAKAWIEEISRLGSIGINAAPDVQYMANKILELLPELQLGLDYYFKT
jgi:hypothetical protein